MLIERKDRPPDLLEERERELSLGSYSNIQMTAPVRALATYPLFDLTDPSTTLFLCSFSDHPIRLHSALSKDLVASYPLVHATTEAYMSPHSLLFTSDGRRFVSGSKNMLATSDVSRPGEDPCCILPTARKGKASGTGSPTTMKGIISALAIEPSSTILAAGTFSRHVGLYAAAGQGDCLGVFRVDGNQADSKIGGAGVTQLTWSQCGRYLYIAERKSRGAMVYDIRKTGQLLSWLEGRNADTNQRIGIGLSKPTQADDKSEIWGGGKDGKVRVWTNPECQEGSVQPDRDWQAHSGKQTMPALHSTG
jgi:telomerase Cajal body protein 1